MDVRAQARGAYPDQQGLIKAESLIRIGRERDHLQLMITPPNLPEDLWSRSSTPQLPFKEPQMPSHRDHKALNKGTFGGVAEELCLIVVGFPWLPGPRRPRPAASPRDRRGSCLKALGDFVGPSPSPGLTVPRGST